MQNTSLSRLEAIIALSPPSNSNRSFNPIKYEILGLTIMERSFRALEKAGVEHITVLANEDAEKLRCLIKNAPSWSLTFSIVENSNLEKVFQSYLKLPPSNGLFFLSEPLVIDPLLLKKMLDKNLRNPHQLLTIKNQKLVLFGPKFLSKTKITTILSGENTLSKNRFLRSYSSSLLCHAVNSQADVQKIEKSLIRNLTKPNDGWVSRNLNRPVSTLFSRLLSQTHITPNQVTLVLVIPSLITAYIFAQGGYWGFLVGGALFHLTSILDGVDGELARLKFKSSLYGKWLDFMCDNLAYLAALVGFLIGLFRDGISPFEKMASIAALVLSLCMMGSIILYYKRFNKDGKLLTVEYGFREGSGWFDRLMQTAELLGKREWFALLFFALAIIGKMEWALIYVCVVAAGVLLFSFQAHARAARLWGT